MIDCNDIKDLLYEELTGVKLEKEALDMIERHLQGCQSCRQEREIMSHILKALDAVTPPPLSPGFQTIVLKKAQNIPLPANPLFQRFKEWFHVPYIKWSLEGLAATAVILIALAIYKDQSLTKPSKIEMIPRSFQMEISKATANHPIIIPTKDLDKTLSSLDNLIKKYDGRIIQTLPQDQEIKVTFSLNKKNEPAFLPQLKKIGSVQKSQDGFRDDEGNMVIVLKLVK